MHGPSEVSGEMGGPGGPAAPMPAPGPAAGQQNPVYIVIQSNRKSADKAHFQKTMPKKIIRNMAIGQLAVATTMIISEIILISSDSWHVTGNGIWAGVPFAVAALFSFIVAFRPTYCTIITCMILNILACLVVIPSLVISGIAMSQNANQYNWKDPEDVEDHEWRRKAVGSVFFAVEMFCGFLFGLSALAMAILSCRATCNCSERSNSAGDFVAYAPTASQIPGDATMVNIPMTAFVPPQMPASDNPPNYENAIEDNTDSGSKYKRLE